MNIINIEVVGKVHKIIYHSKENSFIIAKASIEDNEIPEEFYNAFKSFKDDSGKFTEITVKGNMGMVLLDQKISFTVKIAHDPKYGPYLNVLKYKMLEQSKGILFEAIKQKYIKGISAAILEEIKERYPNNIEDILENHPAELMKIPGIKHKKLGEIMRSYEEFKNDSALNTLCLEYGLSGGVKNKIKRTWNDNIDLAIKAIRQNPYILAEKVHGIGFRTADKIALNMGIDKNDPRRVYASFVYVVKEKMASEGHCYLPYHLLLLHAAYELAGVNEAKKLPPDVVKIVQEEGEKLKKHTLDNGYSFLYTEAYIDPKDNKEKYRIWNNELRYSENNCANRLSALLYSDNNFSEDYDTLSEAITRAEFDQKIQLDPLQREAIISSFCNNVSITTGGPGTGKTTILKIFLDLLMKYQHIGPDDIALVAPTGKAAKRMTEAIDIPGLYASTIHRLLGYNGHEAQFNELKKLPQKYFIVDEFSMVTVDLFSAFLNALPEDSKLLMIGDIDQLPSVGAGNVLKDLIDSNVIPVNRLERIFRQSDRSWISQNAYFVKNGNTLDFNFGIDSEDFFFTEFNSISEMDYKEKEEEYKKNQNMIIAQIEDVLKKTNPKTNKYYTMDDIMVMLPMRKGELGVNKLNELFQKHFNEKGRVVPFLKGKFRIGDKVMQTKNDYDLNVFNGEQGIIKSFDAKEGEMVVAFPDKIVSFKQDKINELELSYAITIHKSQGSEAPVTILCITNSHYIMLQRNLLYTGITRSKNECYLFGEKSAIITAIKNKKIQERNTRLKEKMMEKAEQKERAKEHIFKITQEENYNCSPVF